MFRFLLWRRLNRLLLQVCQPLNGDNLIPKECWSWSRVRVGIKLFNPCDWLSNVFWKWGDPDNLEEDASAANGMQKLTGAMRKIWKEPLS